MPRGRYILYIVTLPVADPTCLNQRDVSILNHFFSNVRTITFKPIRLRANKPVL